MANSLGLGIGFDVFLLDPEGIAKPVRWKLAAPDQSPNLLLAKAQINGGFLNGEELQWLRLSRLRGVGIVHRITSHLSLGDPFGGLGVKYEE